MGLQIKYARLRRKLSAELVAKRAGISRATLCAIEKGAPSVAIGCYAAILHALNFMDKDFLRYKREGFYSFEYDEKWLLHAGTILDPDLKLYKGRQYVSDDKYIFAVFADSCPDRWGRMLMKRKEAVRAKKADEKPDKKIWSWTK